MRAIVIDHFGGLDSLVIKEMPEPEPKPGHVVIKVKAFGVNHAEMHMRKGEWAEAAEISGIECVGIVKSCPGGEFAVGSKVAALMGGLGRTINGSYAEYTRALATGVAPIESDLPWEELAAIPESYATAWTCLFRNLELSKDQTLVIRGAMSAFGQAALNMAVEAGAKVIGTTRSRDGSGKLEDLGARRVELEGPDLSKRIAKQSTLMQYLTSSATVPSLIPSGCCVGAGAPAWRGGSVVSIRSPTSTRSCKWPAASTLPSSAASCSGRPGFPSRTFHFRPSPTRWRQAGIKRSPPGYSALRTFGRRIE
jgi:D-arabinose 1-dehydrogenase-like Zn-dependent alcohol dehydrogenase